jgi:hypothetical protein
MVANSGETENRQSRAKQEGFGPPGVCNDQVPPSKEKVWSELRRNTERSAEMTSPAWQSYYTMQVTTCAGYNNCTDGEFDKPSAFISDQSVWQFYNRTLTQTVRYVDAHSLGDMPFSKLRYMDTTWTWDRQCPSGRLYILNARGTHFYTDPGWFFRWSESRTWPDQLIEVRLLSLRLTLCTKMRMFQQVLDGWTA